MRLILASASPRRKKLLRAAGIAFEARASADEPPPRRRESPVAYARRAARAKALDVAASEARGTLVLGADTIVVAGREILGKPRDRRDAARMLRRLSGRVHRVITGVCLVRAPGRVVALRHSITRVRFRKLGETEIRTYVGTRQPLGKAGAYAIQERASKFVTRIEGCYFNVVGLPVPLVYEMLKPSGI
ncbi:MAG TPA: Maf family protein [Terriglobia bacterium]|nr:Maf family protein [Terriglobia bacterium]